MLQASACNTDTAPTQWVSVVSVVSGRLQPATQIPQIPIAGSNPTVGMDVFLL